MKSYWLGPLVLAGIGAAAALVVAAQKPHVELVRPDPSVAAPVAREAQPQEAAPGLKQAPTVTEAPRKRRAVDPPPKLDTIDPWSDRDLAPEVEALAALEQPHLQLDQRDPWNASTLAPGRPALEPGLDDADPWEENGGRRAEVAKVHVEKQKLDPWAM